MYRLKLFGGVALGTPDRPVEGRAVQRRRLALLSLLALSRSEAVPRERIAALLWPEADGDRARHQVSDSVYRINQALGETAVVAVGDELRLDRAVLSVDALDFADAMHAADWRRSTELYAGALFDGFFIPDAPEFERWADSERIRFGHDYLKALESLALEAESRDERLLAVDYWRRASVHDPHSSRLALHLMRALDRAGERAAAIKHARVHQQLIRQEIGADADPKVEALAEELSMQAPVSTPRDIARASARHERESRQGSEAGTADVEVGPVAGETVPDLLLVGSPDVERSTDASPTAVGQDPSARDDARSPPRARTIDDGRIGRSARSRVTSGAIVLLVVMALLAAWWSLGREGEPATGPGEGSYSRIAVLPFANQSGDASNDYMSDGITDELIGTLGSVRGMRVASRTSVFAFKGRTLDVREIARELGVDAVLEGSLRRSGDRLRVSAQLVTARDGYQLWSENFDRGTEDVLAIQQDIAAAIVNRLRGIEVSATLGSAAHPADDPLAYDLYLQGRFAWHQRTEAGLRRAVDRFSAAVARSPGYARAYAGLGDAYAVLAFYDYVAPRDAFPRARAAAERAIALDSTLAAPHATLGYVDLYFDWRFERAESEFERSIALDPTYSVAHQWYGNLLTSRGRFAEAEREMRLAQELDPLSLIANAALGWIHLHAGRYDEAIAQCRRTLALNDQFALAWMWMGMAQGEAGQADSAIVTLRHAEAISGETGIVQAALARAYALGGARDSARAILSSLASRGVSGYVPHYEIAKAQLALGERDAALASLARALDARAHSMVFLAIDPQFAPLRSSAQFVALRDGVEKQ